MPPGTTAHVETRLAGVAEITANDKQRQLHGDRLVA